KLKQVRIEINHNCLRDCSIKGILDSLKNKSLTSAHFNLQERESLTNRTLDYLQDYLTNTKGLKRLNLHLYMTNYMTDRALESLGNGMEFHRGLVELSLTLEKHVFLGEFSICHLKQFLEILTSLVKLELTIAISNQFSEYNELFKGMKGRLRKL